MKFVKASAAPTSEKGSGGSGMPSWRRKWLHDMVRWVELECGHITDINDATLTFVNTFDGSAIDCVECGSFSVVKRTLKTKSEAKKTPEIPLF
jgi:hypothetical protein